MMLAVFAAVVSSVFWSTIKHDLFVQKYAQRTKFGSNGPQKDTFEATQEVNKQPHGLKQTSP